MPCVKSIQREEVRVGEIRMKRNRGKNEKKGKEKEGEEGRLIASSSDLPAF